MPHMYILECADGSFYTGSTWDLERRLSEHQGELGANFTTKRLPVKLVYCEYFDRVDDAYYREKQVQGWSRRKKQALIEGNKEKLVEYSRNYTQYPPAASTSSATGGAAIPLPSTSSGSGRSNCATEADYPVAEPVEATGVRGTTLPSTSSGSSCGNSAMEADYPVAEPVLVAELVEATGGGAIPLPELVEGRGKEIGYGW
jgi:predicted GIY-YIG superfamily endonuclease